MLGERISIEVAGPQTVSGLLHMPPGAISCYVFAHGAGVGMAHSFMEAVAKGLGERSIGTLRYQFPYMEKGGKRTDPPAVAQATVRAAVEEAVRRAPGTPLIAGGKSFGGRMTSQAQAAEPLPEVRGLAFLGFPLHPPGKPSLDRAEHLERIMIPMLFLQGTRDEFAELDLLRPLCERLGPRTTLLLFEGADHSFKVPARERGDGPPTLELVLDAMAGWVRKVVA
jgi:uncharacterized protein